METTNELPPAPESPLGDEEPSEPPTAPPVAASPRVLRRDQRHRLLGGVAGGIASYVGVDVVVVRIVFVVLSLLGGSGVLLYLAGWLLIPEAEEEQSIAQEVARDLKNRRPTRRNLIVLVVGAVLAIVAVTDLFSSGPWWPHWNHGFGFFFSIVALALAVIVLAGSGGNRSAASRLGWAAVTLLVTLAAIGAVLVATLFSVEALSGVPLSGGIGSSQWRPTAAAQLHSKYRLAIGNLVVDLRGVGFPAGTRQVTASVGIGHLVIEVPSGPTVSVDAHSGMGNVQVFGESSFGDVSTSRTSSATAGSPGDRAHLVLDAQAGVGEVQVVRGSP